MKTTTLSNREAQRLLATLKKIDATGDIKLKGQTRILIAVNINKLTPLVAAFETAGQRRQFDFKAGEEAMDNNKAIQTELMAMADATQKFDLAPMKLADLDLDENVKITGDQIAALAPILSDFGKEAKAA